MKTTVVSTPQVSHARVHELKSWPLFMDLFQHSGVRFDVRVNDRNFQKQDYLLFREYDAARVPHAYGNRCMLFSVSYTLSGWGVSPGHIALGLQRVNQEKAHHILEGYMSKVYPHSPNQSWELVFADTPPEPA